MIPEIDEIWRELSAKLSRGELAFLRKCFRAYSSQAHMNNVVSDLAAIKRASPPPKKVLDFGCGIGLQSFLLANSGYEVHGLETVEDKSLEGFLRANAGKHIRSREESMRVVWEVIQKKVPVKFGFYDGKKLPFPNGYFGVVLAYAVFEHIPPVEIPGILRGISNVMEPDATLYIFQLPQRHSYAEFIARTLGMESHEYLWTLPEMKRALARARLVVRDYKMNDMLINHPHQIVNGLYGFLKLANRVLINTPLSYFAHHLTVIAIKAGAGW